jgi:hypothetical protein
MKFKNPDAPAVKSGRRKRIGANRKELAQPRVSTGCGFKFISMALIGSALFSRPGPATSRPNFLKGGATAENFAASRCGSKGHATYRQKSRNR